MAELLNPPEVPRAGTNAARLAPARQVNRKMLILPWDCFNLCSSYSVTLRSEAAIVSVVNICKYDFTISFEDQLVLQKILPPFFPMYNVILYTHVYTLYTHCIHHMLVTFWKNGDPLRPTPLYRWSPLNTAAASLRGRRKAGSSPLKCTKTLLNCSMRNMWPCINIRLPEKN